VEENIPVEELVIVVVIVEPFCVVVIVEVPPPPEECPKLKRRIRMMITATAIITFLGPLSCFFI
jgi:hypothetical protein